MSFRHSQSLFAIGRNRHLVSMLGQPLTPNVTQGFFVVHQQDSCGSAILIQGSNLSCPAGAPPVTSSMNGQGILNTVGNNFNVKTNPRGWSGVQNGSGD